MTSSVWIGIDLGTSGCRAIAIDDCGTVIAEIKNTFTFNTTSTRQNPEQHWSAVLNTLDQLIPQLKDYEINALAVDATSGSVMLTDNIGKPLSPLLMYNDSNAVIEAEQLSQLAPSTSAAHGASSGLAKCLYLAKNLDGASIKVVHQADWIQFKLGTEIGVTDYNNALKTGFDPVTNMWPHWISKAMDMNCLPHVVSPGDEIGHLHPSLCSRWGLQTTPTLVAGTTDSVAAFIATGVHQPGQAVTSLGSTLVLKFISNIPVFVPELGIYSHKLGKQWLIGGASNSGGSVLRSFFTDGEIETLSQAIDLAQIPPDYYPLTSSGERFPIADPLLKPRISPKPESDALFLHGLLKGIAKIEAQGYQLLQKYSGTALKSICTVGGGAQNSVWQSIRETMIGVPFTRAKQTEAAYGSAVIARDGLK